VARAVEYRDGIVRILNDCRKASGPLVETLDMSDVSPRDDGTHSWSVADGCVRRNPADIPLAGSRFDFALRLSGHTRKHLIHVGHQCVAQRCAKHLCDGAPGVGRREPKHGARARRKSLDQPLAVK